MKNVSKILGAIVFSLLLVSVFHSCNKDNEELLGDDQLISAIQNANNKQVINAEQLPSNSKLVIRTDYSDSYTDAALLAPELGYEVSVRKHKGADYGELSQTYFDMNGRELKSSKGKGKGGRKGEGERKKECFKFVFPVTFIMNDASTITANSEEEMKNAIKAWYEANPDTKERPTLQFPVTIEFEDGTTQEIANEDEMKAIHEKCREEKDEKKCFEHVFPISFTMPDASIITVNNGEELRDKLKAWHEANPDVKERGTINFPIDIKFKDGTTLTVNSEDEMKAVHEKCDGKGKDKKHCFDFVFPVTFTMPDASTITANNKEELHNALKAWHDTNPDVKERGKVNYPVDILYEDGTTLTINNDDEMKAAHDKCEENKN